MRSGGEKRASVGLSHLEFFAFFPQSVSQFYFITNRPYPFELDITKVPAK